MTQKRKTSGFVYVWFDRKHKRYYVGSHWGDPSDRYICSSTWMRNAYTRRPEDFKRRIVATITTTREDLLDEEQRWLDMIKFEETRNGSNPNPRYYNLNLTISKNWHTYEDSRLTVGQKISKKNKGRVQPASEVANRTATLRKMFDERLETRLPDFEEIKRRAESGMSLPDIAKELETSNTYIRTVLKRHGISNIKQIQPKRVASEEARRKISLANKDRPGKPHTEEAKLKLSKQYLIVSPNYEVHVIHNLKQFCRDRGLANTAMLEKKGKWPGSKGWHAALLAEDTPEAREAVVQAVREYRERPKGKIHRMKNPKWFLVTSPEGVQYQTCRMIDFVKHFPVNGSHLLSKGKSKGYTLQRLEGPLIPQDYLDPYVMVGHHDITDDQIEHAHELAESRRSAWTSQGF